MLKVTYFYKEVIYSPIQGKGTPLPSEILNHYQFILCRSFMEQMDFSLIATVTFKKKKCMWWVENQLGDPAVQWEGWHFSPAGAQLLSATHVHQKGEDKVQHGETAAVCTLSTHVPG